MDTACLISLPKSIFDNLLDSSWFDYSNKWSNIESGEEIITLETKIPTLSGLCDRVKQKTQQTKRNMLCLDSSNIDCILILMVSKGYIRRLTYLRLIMSYKICNRLCICTLKKQKNAIGHFFTPLFFTKSYSYLYLTYIHVYMSPCEIF